MPSRLIIILLKNKKTLDASKAPRVAPCFSSPFLEDKILLIINSFIGIRQVFWLRIFLLFTPSRFS
jgi:hypothetical protein